MEQDKIILGKQFEVIGQELRRMTGKNNALESHIGNLRGNLDYYRAEMAGACGNGNQLWNRTINLKALE